MYRALYDFSSSDPGALSFKKGEVFQVSKKIDEHWLMGKNKSGDTGLLPVAYVQLQEVPAGGQQQVQQEPYFAAYDYNGRDQLQLTVSRGQKLFLVEKSAEAWWTMKTEDSRVGLIPKQYVQVTRPRPVSHLDQLNPKAQLEVLQSTDRAIEQIHQQAAANDGVYTSQQRNNLQALVAHRRSLVQPMPQASDSPHDQRCHVAPAPPQGMARDSEHKKSKRRAPPIPPPTTSPPTIEQINDAMSTSQSQEDKQKEQIKQHKQEDKQQQKQDDEQQKQEDEQQHRQNSVVEDTSSYVVIEKKIEDIIKEFDSTIGTELVEAVRTNCDINHVKSLTAVQVVLDFISSAIPQLQPTMSAMLEAVHKSQADNADKVAKLETSADHDRLTQLFEQITAVKNDSQQRGWAVHDDLSTITNCLEELLQRLGDADPDVSVAIIQEYKYENVLTLVAYYQMETRTSLRLLLLQLFGLMCGLELEVVPVLLNSVLPNELGRDVHDNIEDTQKVLYSSLVCTMVFSTADAAPLSVYDQFSVEYVTFLLDTIEASASDSSQEEVADSFLNLLLSFNQHFEEPTNNIVMMSLMEQPNRKVFGEKLVLLVNREEDPVIIKEPNIPNSLTKMMLDLFSHTTTAALFYTNDLLVVIDIITRQLSDLNPDDKNRGYYLILLYRLLKTTDYSKHAHRQADLEQCLTRIFEEEELEGMNANDKETVKLIWQEYRDYFKYSTTV